jgi:hypothetical protein
MVAVPVDSGKLETQQHGSGKAKVSTGFAAVRFSLFENGLV